MVVGCAIMDTLAGECWLTYNRWLMPCSRGCGSERMLVLAVFNIYGFLSMGPVAPSSSAGCAGFTIFLRREKKKMEKSLEVQGPLLRFWGMLGIPTLAMTAGLCAWLETV